MQCQLLEGKIRNKGNKINPLSMLLIVTIILFFDKAKKRLQSYFYGVNTSGQTSTRL